MNREPTSSLRENSTTRWCSAVLLGGLALACQPALPRPVQPLTPTPDAPFRAVRPAPLSTPARHRSAPTAERFVLPNGMQVVSLRRPGGGLVSLALVNIRAGLLDTGYAPELVMLTGDMLIRGGTTLAHGEVLRRLRINGNAIAAITSNEDSTLSLDVTSPALPQALSLLARTVRHPAFGERELLATAQVELDWLSFYDDVPARLARLIVPPLHPQGARLVPTLQPRAFLGIDRPRLLDAHEALYRPEFMTLVVVGDFSAAELELGANAHFGDWQAREGAAVAPPPPEPEVSSPRPAAGLRIHSVESEAEQSSLLLLQRGPALAASDEVAFSVLAELLGGFDASLNTPIRHEQGASYGVHAELYQDRTGGLLTVLAAVEHRALASSIQAIVDVMRALQARPPTQDDLAVAKRRLLADHASVFATTAGACSALARSVAAHRPLDHHTQRNAAVEAITPADVQRVARAYLTPDALDIAVWTDRRQTHAALRRLGSVARYREDGTPE